MIIFKTQLEARERSLAITGLVTDNKLMMMQIIVFLHKAYKLVSIRRSRVIKDTQIDIIKRITQIRMGIGSY